MEMVPLHPDTHGKDRAGDTFAVAEAGHVEEGRGPSANPPWQEERSSAYLLLHRQQVGSPRLEETVTITESNHYDIVMPPPELLLLGRAARPAEGNRPRNERSMREKGGSQGRALQRPGCAS